MLILGLASSAKAASAALCRDGELLGQYTQCSGLTHSRTLLPMVEDLLKNTETKLADVDAVAVARGPGSFTGIRIGVAAVKGLCWGAQKPAIGVSTLAAMAWTGVAAGEGSIICCCMDARRQQVYKMCIRDSSSTASPEMMLKRAPEWSVPTVTTMGSSGLNSRLEMVCSASTMAEAATVASMPSSGSAPWLALPVTVSLK